MENVIAVVLFILLIVQAIILNGVERLGLPWMISEYQFKTEKSIALTVNSGQENEYFISSKYSRDYCSEGVESSVVIERGKKLLVYDVDKIYRFPEFSLKYKLLYKTMIDGVRFNIITDRTRGADSIFYDLMNEIRKSKC